MSSDSKNDLGFVVDEFSELRQSMKSLGNARQCFRHLEMSSDSKNDLGFVVDEFSELRQSMKYVFDTWK